MSMISEKLRKARQGVKEEDTPAAQALRLAAYGAASGRLREQEEQEAQGLQSLRLAAYGAAQDAALANARRPAPSYAGTLRAVPDSGTGTSVAKQAAQQEYEAGKERARYLDFSTGAELQRRLREAEDALSLSGGGRAEDAAARAAKAELDKWQSDVRAARGQETFGEHALNLLGDAAAGFMRGVGNPVEAMARLMELPEDALYWITGDERFNQDSPDRLTSRASKALTQSSEDTFSLSRPAEERPMLERALVQTAQAAGNMLSAGAIYGQAFDTANTAGLEAAANATPELGASLASRAATAVTSAGARAGLEILRNPGNFGISLGSGVNAYSEALGSGADFGQAVTNGFAKGLTEYFSNKLFSGTPFENNPAEKGYVTRLTEHIAQKIGKSEALAAFNTRTGGKVFNWVMDKTGEGMEEVVTAIADPLIDRLTYDEDADFATADELVEEFLGGILLSLAMSPAETLADNVERHRVGADLLTGETVGQIGDVTVPGVDEATAALIESGLESPEGTESRRLAETALARAQEGKEISARMRGELAAANAAQVASEESAATEVAQEERPTGDRGRQIVTEGNPRSGAAPTENEAARAAENVTLTAEDRASEVRRVAVEEAGLSAEAGDTLADIFTQAAPEGVDPAAFASVNGYFYQAGERGLPFDKVRESIPAGAWSAAGGTEEIAQYAYNRGRMKTLAQEAEAERRQREAERKAAERAQLQREAERNRRLAASEAGLHEDDFTRANLSAADARRIDETARLLGTPVYVVGNNEIGAGRAQGELAGGRAVLLEQGLFEGENAGTSAGLRIAGHEWGHRLKRLAPTEYGQVVEALRPMLTKEIEQKRHLYNEQNGLNYSDAELTEEAVNDRLGDMLRDGRILDEFIEEHRQERGLLQRMWEGIKSLARKLTGAEKRAAQSAEAKLRAALDAAATSARQESSESRVQSSEGTENAAQEGGEGAGSEFSLKSPIEETKDLLAVHGMTAENLRGALRLGGLPMPSIAVVKAEAGHNRYGEISLVFDKSTIDPEADRRNKVYGADAWTPTAPRVDYELDHDGVLKLEDRIKELSRSVADGIFGDSSILRSAGVDDSTSIGVDELAEKLGGTDAVKAAYLAERGETLEPVKKAKVWGKYGNESLQRLIDQIGPQRLAQINSDLWAGMRISEALGPEEETIRQIIRDYYIDKDEAILQKRAQRNGWTEEQTSAKREAHADSMMEKNVSLFTLEDFARNAWAMYEDGGATRGEYDYYATQETLRKAVSDKTATEWIRPQIEALYGEPALYNGKDPYTASGNRRSFRQLHDAYTLENIVKAMSTQQSQRGEGVWIAGAHGLQATATPSYRSIAEIKADSGRLGTVSEEKLKRLSDAVNDELDEVVTEIVGTGGYQEREIAGEVLMMAAQGSKTVAAIRNTFARESEYKISEATAKKIQQLYKDAAALPTEYFESKPQRAVGFDEVLAAVVPTDLDADLKQGLRDAGVQNVLEYELFNNADRTAKLNSVEGARFSLKEPDAATLTALQRENERLRERVEYWRGQTKQTRGLHLRYGDLSRLTGQLVKDYGAELDEGQTAALEESLRRLGRIMREDPKGLQYSEMLAGAEEVARELVQNARELVNDDEYQDYRDLRKWLRGQKLTISRSDAAGIADFNEWKKAHSAIRVGYDNGGLPIDTAYAELAEQFPGFFPEEIDNPTDQLERIGEILDSVGPVYENPYSPYMAAAIEEAGYDVLERIMDEDTVRPAAPTRADKQAAKYEARLDAKDEQIKDLRERYTWNVAQRVAQERAKRDSMIAAIKGHQAEVRENERNRRQESQDRDRLLRVARRLAKLKTTEANRAVINELIGDLDLVSKGLTTESIENLVKLREWYEGKTTEGSDNYDPDFIADKNTLDKLRRLEQRKIKDLTITEVRELTESLLNIEHEIRTAKKLIDSEDRRDVYYQALDIAQHMEDTKGWKKGVISGMLSPERFARRVTGYAEGDPLQRAMSGLSAGQRTMWDYQRRALQDVSRWTGNREFMRRWSGKDAQRIRIDGDDGLGHHVTATITPGMLASLYLHSMNDDNMKHVAKGGVTIPNAEAYRKGDYENAYRNATTMRLQRSQIQRLAQEHLSAEDRAFIRAIMRYFNETSKAALGETAEKLLGYSPFNVDRYFPISVDQNFLHTDFDSMGEDGSVKETLADPGYAQERKQDSKPIDLRDANDVLADAIRKHSQYVGLAIPVRNVNKLIKVEFGTYTEEGERVSHTGSLKKTLNKTFGKAAIDYLNQLMKDVQGNRTRDNSRIGDLIARMRSNYAGAVLTLNAGVAIKQAASYPTAAAVLKYRHLARALKYMAPGVKVDTDLIQRYTPLLWYRSLGYSSQEQGELQNRGRPIPKKLNWIQAMDVKTTAALWKAAEYQIAEERKDLQRGSDGFYKAVAELYNRVIEETQPNYSVMQRPEILRTTNELTKTLNMFKTQPFQNFNILYDAVGDWQAQRRAYSAAANDEARAEARKRMDAAKRKLGRALSSQLISSLVFALMQYAWDAFRRKDDKYKDKEGNADPAAWLKGIGLNMLGNGFGMLPFGSELLEWGEALTDKLLQNAGGDPFFEQKFYGFDASVLETMTNLATGAASLIARTVQTIQNATDSEKKTDWEAMVREAYDAAVNVSQALGIPVENVRKTLTAVAERVLVRAAGPYLGEYYAMRIADEPKSGNSRQYYDLLYRAMENDKAAYEELYKLFIDDGSGLFTHEKIRENMEKRMKAAQGVNSVTDLAERYEGTGYMSAEQQKRYDELRGPLTRSPLWREATKEQRGRVEDKLYQLAAETSTSSSAGTKLQEKIDAAGKAGISEGEYMLYLLALSMADEPRKTSGEYGTYTNDEQEAALDMLDGLSREDKSWLWMSTHDSDKNNPYK